MRRILNQTWVKFALYMLIVMLFISFVILATVWYNFYGNNIAKNAECLDLAYRELKKAYESPLLERVAVKPYFALGKDKDAETVRYSSSGDCFYYEYDSKVMGSNIIILKDSTLYYQFRRKLQDGSYGNKVVFRVEDMAKYNLSNILMMSKLPILTAQDYCKDDQDALIKLINESRFSSDISIDKMLSLRHPVYGNIRMIVAANSLTVFKNDNIVYQYSVSNESSSFAGLWNKFQKDTDFNSHIILKKSSFVFHVLAKYF